MARIAVGVLSIVAVVAATIALPLNMLMFGAFYAIDKLMEE